MTLKLYNTLTRTKEEFKPLDPKNVRMYVCGPTVYDYAHIGNARPVIVFDVLFRLLRHLYDPEHVTYVRNITDVEDKINDRAAIEYPNLPLNDAIRLVTKQTEAQFHQDVDALGCLKPTSEPRATEHIDEMKKIIEALLAKGFAYVAENHVLFQVSKMANYGQLSRRSLDEMIAGARVDVAPYKKEPMDFVLWKPSKVAGVDGANYSEPGWPSPCGIPVPGRPGWHIECSAMSKAALGETFDIHGGGIDLIFPHHENEIAQSLCAFGTKLMAKYWMHNGFLQVEGQKMSKSLGNFLTIHEHLNEKKFGLQRWHGRTLRLAMLMTHYRQPIDWTVDRLIEARNNIYDWNKQCHEAPIQALDADLLHALKDDLNTPEAISALHALSKAARAPQTGPEFVAANGRLRAGLEFFGLYENEESINLLAQDVRTEDQSYVNSLVLQRNIARKAKNWAESDRIRDELAAMGVTLEDNKDGTTTPKVKR